MTDVKVQQQAEAILKVYTEQLQGLMMLDCRRPEFSESQCQVLTKVLDRGWKGEITSQEREELAKVGFAKEFIQEIAGTDGKKALERRVLFFAPQIQGMLTDLRNSDEFGRCWAAGALGVIGDTQVVEPLITAFKVLNAKVRCCAAKALGEIGDTRAVGPLITALKDSSEDVRYGVVEALNEILDKDGLMALIPYLRDLDQMVAGKIDDCNVDCQNAAGQVLQKLEEQMR